MPLQKYGVLGRGFDRRVAREGARPPRPCHALTGKNDVVDKSAQLRAIGGVAQAMTRTLDLAEQRRALLVGQARQRAWAQELNATDPRELVDVDAIAALEVPVEPRDRGGRRARSIARLLGKTERHTEVDGQVDGGERPDVKARSSDR